MGMRQVTCSPREMFSARVREGQPSASVGVAPDPSLAQQLIVLAQGSCTCHGPLFSMIVQRDSLASDRGTALKRVGTPIVMV